MDSRLHADNLQKVIGEVVKGCGQVHAVILDQKIN